MASSSDRRLAAIMFTDIVGYSSLMTQDESQAVEILKKKDSILKPLIIEHSGHYVKNTGDGSLSYFDSAVDAVKCAKKFQKSFQENNEIKIRIGIHLGDIILENEDIFGDGVNIASRLESMAIERSILISKEVYDQISNHSEFDAISLGLQSFKGVGRLIEVYSLKADFLASPSPNNYQSNLVPKHEKDDGIPSLAIIPFKNKGKDEDVFYSYGISAGIIKTCRQAGMIRVEGMDRIEKIENYDNLSHEDLANKLSVKYIITGSLWKLDEVFQLSIEIYDSEKSELVWSDHFEEAWGDLSLIKNKLTEGVLKTLDTDSNISDKINSIDPRAYEYYLKGKYKYEKRQNSEDTEIARSMFKKAVKLDPRLIDAKLWLGETYTETGKYKEAMQIFKEGITDAEESNDTRAKGMAYECIGNIHWHKGKYNKSLENLYISLDIMKDLNDQAGIAKSLHHIGHNYYYKGDYDKAHDYYNRSIEIVEKLGDKNGMGHALLSLGNIYEVKNNIDGALSCYEESYSISTELDDKYAAGYAQMGIGNIYTGIKKYKEAIECYEMSLKTRKEIDDQNGMAYIYHNIGVSYKYMCDYDNALESFTKALDITNSLEDQFASSATLKNIAEIHRIKGDYKKAFGFHNRGLSIRKKIGEENGIIESLNCIGLVYYFMGNFEKSTIYLNKVKELEFKNEEQSLFNEIYLALNAKALNQKFSLEELISSIEDFKNLTYEAYYFLYIITENSKYLKLAYQNIEEVQKLEKNNSKFLEYPIPKAILEKHNI